jgi:hypothetical protein
MQKLKSIRDLQKRFEGREATAYDKMSYMVVAADSKNQGSVILANQRLHMELGY